MHREELATVRAGRSGREVVVAHQLELIRAAARQPCRLLEVGCGKGDVAAALANAGYRVTAIDPELPDDVMKVRNVRFERVGIEEFGDDEPYDAIAFTASLHHVHDLAAVLDRAAALLGPRGTAIFDEFDVNAPDEATALWFFELQELLAVASLYDPARIEGKTSQSPLVRWLAAHAARGTVDARSALSGEIGGSPHEIHGAAQMVAAIKERFAIQRVDGGPYLYRYIARGIRGPRAPWIAEAVRDAEKRRIALRLMPAVGLTIVARPKTFGEKAI